MSLRTLPARARSLVSHAEAWWFDRTRHVSTTGNLALDHFRLVGQTSECFEYLPSRAATARVAIERLPIHDYSEYTFVDMGSGLGKILFLAAEHPFRAIHGVEFATELHRLAERNIARYRSSKRRCARIDSLNVNAVDYLLPEENLVLYFFNPFGPAIMKTVLSNLAASLERHPREVFLVLCYPELASLVRAAPFLQPIEENRRFALYRNIRR